MAGLDLLESAVLVAVFRGLDTPDALRKVINVESHVLEEVIKRLVDQGLISVELRGFIFKKPKLKLTRKGVEHLEQAMERLKNLAGEVEAKIRERRGTGVEDSLDYTLLSVLPLLVWLGMLDAAMISSLSMYNALSEADQAVGEDEAEEQVEAVEEAEPEPDLDIDVEGDII